MEFLLELIFEIIIEGSLELGTTKKVPMPLRILACALLLIIYGGLITIFILLTIDAWQTKGVFVGGFLAAIDLFLIIVFIGAFRNKLRENNHKSDGEI